ncbi:MAG TPA: alpha/beta fold hydrolase [Baekduia sp.]
MAHSPSPFVLVPGAGGDGWYWSRVAPLLRAAGREAVVVDLPAGDEEAGLEEYADVVVEAIDGHEDVTLVAQSMGAFSAPIAATWARVGRLLLIAPMIPAPGESASSWWSASGQDAAWRASEVAGGRDPEAPFDEREAFFHDVAPEIVDEAYGRPEPRQADKPFVQPFPLEAWPSLPTAVLLGRRDRLFPYTFMVGLTRARLGVEPDAVDTGHLASLARPRATADWLLAQG